MDPISLVGSITTLIEGGRQVGDLSKKIVSAMRSIDMERAEIMHRESSGGVTGNMRATERFIRKQELARAEEELRQIIVAYVGPSGWKELQEMRKIEAKRDREAAQAIVDAQSKKREIIFATIIALLGSTGIGAIIYLIIVL